MSKRCLSCMTPDGRTLFSVGSNKSSTDSSFPAKLVYDSILVDVLPLNQGSENPQHSGTGYKYDKDNIDKPKASPPRGGTFELPYCIAASLRLDPPLGLLYCDTKYSIDDSKTTNVQIALYSQTAVWLLLVQFSASLSSWKIISSLQPFEAYLLANSSTRILRVRGAPSSEFYLAPCGCLAMLTSDGALALYHPPSSLDNSSLSRPIEGLEGFITTPVSMASMITDSNTSDEYDEEVDTADVLRVTDFCFGITTSISKPDTSIAKPNTSIVVDPSNMGEMVVYFLCQNGDIYAASPIIFDKASISASAVDARIEFLEFMQRQQSSEEKIQSQEAQALNKTYLASIFWMKNVFGVSGSQAQRNSRSHQYQYSTASLLSQGSFGAGAFPVQIQGPILANRLSNDSTPFGQAVCIEVLPCQPQDTLPGMTVICLGRQPFTPSTMEVQVDICLLTKPILTRFEFESEDDRDLLDEHHSERRGIVLESMIYEFTTTSPTAEYEEEYLEKKSNSIYLDIVVDPVRPHLIHVGTMFGICTMGLEFLPKTIANIRRRYGYGGQKDVVESKSSVKDDGTFAYACLSLGTSFTGVGFQSAVVSNNAELGHVLVAKLTNGRFD